MEMKAQPVADVISIFIASLPSLLHQNNVGVTYAKISNFKMELVKSMPIYFVAMPKSIITITEVLFVSALVHIVDGVKSKPQTPRGTKFVNLHKYILRKVNIIFTSQPSDLGGGDSNPQGLPRPPR